MDDDPNPRRSRESPELGQRQRDFRSEHRGERSVQQLGDQRGQRGRARVSAIRHGGDRQSERGKSDYKALQTQFNKRFSHRWQANATYTLAYSTDAQVQSQTGPDEVPFKLADDFGYQYTLSTGDQRHRATASGIVQLGYGFQASGTYFYGSGAFYGAACGGDYRNLLGNLGSSASNTRYCDQAHFATFLPRHTPELQWEPGTTILVRNQLQGLPIHRVDMRLTKNIKVTNKDTFDIRVDLFNAFNHANYSGYTSNLANASYGLPSQTSVASAGTVYNPRTLQFGFRATF